MDRPDSAAGYIDLTKPRKVRLEKRTTAPPSAAAPGGAIPAAGLGAGADGVSGTAPIASTSWALSQPVSGPSDDPTFGGEYRAPESRPTPPRVIAGHPGGVTGEGRRPIFRSWALVAASLVVALTAVGVGLAIGRGQSDVAQKPPVATVTVVAPPAPAPANPAPAATISASAASTTQPSDPQAVAYDALMTRLRSDQPAVASRMDGRLVAKLASKTAGIVDPLQTAANGTHTFGWSDVLAEHEAFRSDPRFGTSVLLLTSDLVGSRRSDTVSGRPYLITIADVGFSSRNDVLSWCRRMFPALGDAERNNTCMPMSMKVG